jgi:lipopolysaccharide export system protein LptA
MSEAFHLPAERVKATPMPNRRSLGHLAMRSFAAAFLASAAVALGFGSLAGAQGIAGFNPNQPVNYAADRIELQDRQNRVVLSGNVEITQGDLRLTAGRTTVAFTDAGSLRIQRIDATGGVTVTRGGESARGAAAVYDLNRRTIILTGGVALRRGTDTLNGSRLTMNLNTGRSTVEGGGTQTGRVTGQFSVPEQ